ncbi:MAG: hypothetical protein JJD98_03050 [Polaromonas sp.]|nr:hypothetical protein [Polaromonas sp.]
MTSKLVPITLELSDELTAELTITAHAKGLTLEEWVTILVKKAITELPANPTTQTDESQALAESSQDADGLGN